MKRLAAALLLAWAACCTAYYLPGTYPQEFFLGQNIQGGSNNFSPPVLCATGNLRYRTRKLAPLARCTLSRSCILFLVADTLSCSDLDPRC